MVSCDMESFERISPFQIYMISSRKTKIRTLNCQIDFQADKFNLLHNVNNHQLHQYHRKSRVCPIKFRLYMTAPETVQRRQIC